jgi:basic membrane protein A
VDQFESYPEVQSCLLTSAEKKLAVAVKSWISTVVKGSVKSGNVVFDVTNGGVGLAPFHNFDSKVTSDQKAKLQELQKQLADGTLKTGAET